MAVKAIMNALLKKVAAPGEGLPGESVLHQSWRLMFDRGVLSVHNPFRLHCESGEAFDFAALIGCGVTDAYTAGDWFYLVFEGNLVLAISLREEDYVRREAVSFHDPAGKLIFELTPD